MFKKILLSFVFIIISIICLFGLYYLFNGGIATLVDTTREVSFWQTVKDLFVGIYNGFLRTIGL